MQRKAAILVIAEGGISLSFLINGQPERQV